MRHYQPKKNNEYQLPHDLYMRMLYLVRDYERMKKEANEIADSYPIPSGQHTILKTNQRGRANQRRRPF